MDASPTFSHSLSISSYSSDRFNVDSVEGVFVHLSVKRIFFVFVLLFVSNLSIFSASQRLRCINVGFQGNFINPFMPNGLFYHNSSDSSVSNIKGVW